MSFISRNRGEGLLAVPVLLLFASLLCGFSWRDMKTDHGMFLIDAEMAEQAHIGNNSLKFQIRDSKTLQPVDQGIGIQIVTWMPVHEHGSPVAAEIAPVGDGSYKAEKVNFTMPGPWEVHVLVSRGQEDDEAVLEVQVEGGNSHGMGMDMKAAKHMMGH
jgi:hypothetical protein